MARDGETLTSAKEYTDTKITNKQDKLTFDTTPTSDSPNPVTSGGVYTALADKVTSNHTHGASQVTAGTFAGAVVANASAVSTVTTKQVRNIYAGTDDMTAGTTALTTGDIYLVYE